MPGPIPPGGQPTAQTRTVDPTAGVASRRFPATASSVGQARRFLLGRLPAGGAERTDALVLMLSELATNAVQHAATEFEVSVRVSPDCVRVEVSDGAPGYPTLQEPATDAPHGRGLIIVRSLAEAWGVEMRRDRPGKTVWFRVARVVAGGGRSGTGPVDRRAPRRRPGSRCPRRRAGGGVSGRGSRAQLARPRRASGARRPARRRGGHRPGRRDPLRQRGGRGAHGLAPRVPPRTARGRPRARVPHAAGGRRLRRVRARPGRGARRAPAARRDQARRRFGRRHRAGHQHLRSSAGRPRGRRHLAPARRAHAAALVRADERAARDPGRRADRRAPGGAAALDPRAPPRLGRDHAVGPLGQRGAGLPARVDARAEHRAGLRTGEGGRPDERERGPPPLGHGARRAAVGARSHDGPALHDGRAGAGRDAERLCLPRALPRRVRRDREDAEPSPARARPLGGGTDGRRRRPLGRAAARIDTSGRTRAAGRRTARGPPAQRVPPPGDPGALRGPRLPRHGGAAGPGVGPRHGRPVPDRHRGRGRPDAPDGGVARRPGQAGADRGVARRVPARPRGRPPDRPGHAQRPLDVERAHGRRVAARRPAATSATTPYSRRSASRRT